MSEQDLNNYLSLTEAGEISGYSQEYLSLRARQKKLRAVKMGRNWVTTREWLDEYLNYINDFKNNNGFNSKSNGDGVIAIKQEAAANKPLSGVDNLERAIQLNQGVVSRRFQQGFVFQADKAPQNTVKLSLQDKQPRLVFGKLAGALPAFSLAAAVCTLLFLSWSLILREGVFTKAGDLAYKWIFSKTLSAQQSTRQPARLDLSFSEASQPLIFQKPASLNQISFLEKLNSNYSQVARSAAQRIGQAKQKIQNQLADNFRPLITVWRRAQDFARGSWDLAAEKVRVLANNCGQFLEQALGLKNKNQPSGKALGRPKSESSPLGYNQGLVVMPSAGPETDQQVKEKIKSSFSDEVRVEPKDQESGIIIPIFKEREGESYLYITVPIKSGQ